MRGIFTLGAMVSLMTLSACATGRPYNHIDAGARPLIKEMDSVLISKQSVVGTDIKTSKLSSYIQGHFAPVLFDLGVNAYRSNKAKKLVEPIRDTLGEYDITTVVEADFNEALVESNLEGLETLQVLREEQRGFRAAYIRRSEADAVMFIDVKYAFTPSFDALNLTSLVMIFPVNPELSPYKEIPDTDYLIEYSDNIYRNQFSSVIPVGIEGGKTSENGAVWAEMSEEDLTSRLKIASQKLAEHIARDLSIDDVPEGEEEEEEVVVEEAVTEDITEDEPSAEEAVETEETGPEI